MLAAVKKDDVFVGVGNVKFVESQFVAESFMFP
jgi:hypothetical protein